MLYPTVFSTTRPQKATLLDNIFLSWPTKFCSYVHAIDISDHFPISVSISCVSSNVDNVRFRLSRKFTQSNIRKFSDSLVKVSRDNVLSSNDANLAYDMFLDTFLIHFNVNFPLTKESFGKKTHLKKPWMTIGLLTSLKNRARLYKQFLTGKIGKVTYTIYKNTLTKLIRARKKQYYDDFFYKNNKNGAAIWKMINSTVNSYVNEQFPTNVNQLNTFFC